MQISGDFFFFGGGGPKRLLGQVEEVLNKPVILFFFGVILFFFFFPAVTSGHMALFFSCFFTNRLSLSLPKIEVNRTAESWPATACWPTSGNKSWDGMHTNTHKLCVFVCLFCECLTGPCTSRRCGRARFHTWSITLVDVPWKRCCCFAPSSHAVRRKCTSPLIGWQAVVCVATATRDQGLRWLAPSGVSRADWGTSVNSPVCQRSDQKNTVMI